MSQGAHAMASNMHLGPRHTTMVWYGMPLPYLGALSAMYLVFGDDVVWGTLCRLCGPFCGGGLVYVDESHAGLLANLNVTTAFGSR